MFSVLSWNIRQGGGSRISKIAQAIKNLNPEVAALNEYRNNSSGNKLRTFLLSMGYRYQVVSHAKSHDNSAFLASRYPCSSAIFPGCDPEFDHNIVCGNFPAFDIYSVYFPHKKKHNLFPFLIEEELNRDRPAIIVGDFNSGINGVDQKGNSFWYSEYFGKLEAVNYIDAFRYIHNDKREYSWFSHQGNGYRYDHTYISRDLVPFIDDCRYLQKWREDGLSDHAPMLLTLKV